MSRRSSPPLSPGRSTTPFPEGDFSVHIMEALMEEDMERLRARRDGSSQQRFQMNEDRDIYSDTSRIKLQRSTAYLGAVAHKARQSGTKGSKRTITPDWCRRNWQWYS